MSNRETVTVDCLVDRMTDSAVHIRYRDHRGREHETWIPLSMCEAPDTISVDDEEITIARWIAEDREIPY